MDHATFKRAELDLFVDKKISLRQALCGFKFSFEHLDGHKMVMTCSPGEVIAPGRCCTGCAVGRRVGNAVDSHWGVDL
jgi:DnaJ-class molecular chaperone